MRSASETVSKAAAKRVSRSRMESAHSVTSLCLGNRLRWRRLTAYCASDAARVRFDNLASGSG
jgi:hypothetical protein